jgi:hypothetical protein
MLFGETVAVYCENHTEHADTLSGGKEHISLFNPLKNSGYYIYHLLLRLRRSVFMSFSYCIAITSVNCIGRYDGDTECFLWGTNCILNCHSAEIRAWSNKEDWMNIKRNVKRFRFLQTLNIQQCDVKQWTTPSVECRNHCAFT